MTPIKLVLIDCNIFITNGITFQSEEFNYRLWLNRAFTLLPILIYRRPFRHWKLIDKIRKRISFKEIKFKKNSTLIENIISLKLFFILILKVWFWTCGLNIIPPCLKISINLINEEFVSCVYYLFDLYNTRTFEEPQEPQTPLKSVFNFENTWWLKVN